MKRSRHLPSAFAFALQILVSGPLFADPVTLTIVEIEDGDTLVVTINGEQKRLQLAGIDAPEETPNPKLIRDAERTGLSHDALLSIGQLATMHLKTLARPGEKLALQDDLGQPDRYGRIPAVVIGRDGRSLNAAMVEDGFAVTLEDQQLSAELSRQLQDLEKEAIAEGRGLWGSHPELAKSWSGLP